MIDLNSYTQTEYANFIIKLRDYCDCIPITLTDEEIWKGGLFQIMMMLSSYMRWTDRACKGFLNELRQTKKEIDIKCCMSGIELDHKHIQNIVSFDLYKIQECNETKYTIFSPEYSNLIDRVKFCKDTILTNGGNSYKLSEIAPCCLSSCCNDCKTTYFVDITYNAGLLEIPECLLPIICKLYLYLQVMNNCKQDCNILGNVAYNAVIKEQIIGDTKWSWEIPNNLIETAFSEFVKVGLFSVLNDFTNKSPKIFTIDII